MHGDGTKFKSSGDIQKQGDGLDKDSKGLDKFKQDFANNSKNNNRVKHDSDITADKPDPSLNLNLIPAPGIDQKEFDEAVKKHNEKTVASADNYSYDPMKKESYDPTEQNKNSSMTIDKILDSKNV